MESFETSAATALAVSFLLAAVSRFAADAKYYETHGITRVGLMSALYGGFVGLLATLVWLGLDKSVDVFWLWAASIAVGLLRVNVKQLIQVVSRLSNHKEIGKVINDQPDSSERGSNARDNRSVPDGIVPHLA